MLASELKVGARFTVGAYGYQQFTCAGNRYGDVMHDPECVLAIDDEFQVRAIAKDSIVDLTAFPSGPTDNKASGS